MSEEQGSFWAVPEPEKDKLRSELAQLTAQIMELSNELAELNGVLAPVFAREQQIKLAINDTYARGQGGKIKFNFDGIPDRKPLFADLLTIAEQWGKPKAERSRMISLIKAYQREAAKIADILNHDQKRKQRKSRGKT